MMFPEDNSVLSLVDRAMGSVDSKAITNFQVADLNRPNDSKRIRTELCLSVNRRDTTSINEYLDSFDKREMNFFNCFSRHILPTDSMNPHINPYPLERYYVRDIGGRRPTHLQEFEELVSINAEGDLRLVEYCRERGGILHIGEKGSGKTFAQNVWLHENNSLLEKHRIFWVRLDAAKLINLWNRSPERGQQKLTTIEDYFLCHLVYVFCKHFRPEFPMSSPLFVEIAHLLAESQENRIANRKRYTRSQKKEAAVEQDLLTDFAVSNGYGSIIECLKELERQISVSEHYFESEDARRDYRKPRGKWYLGRTDASFVVDHVLFESQQAGQDRFLGSRTVWKAIGETLREFMIANEYRILYIVDGVDNVNYRHQESANYIDNILRGLFDYCLSNRKRHPNELLMMAIRDTTYESLRKLRNENEYDDSNRYRNVDNFIMIHQDSKGVQPLALGRRLKYVEDKCEGGPFMKRVMDQIQIENQIPDERRWNSNIRCFMNNHLSLAKLITFRWYYAGKPRGFDISEMIKTFENVNFLLNGNLFVDEKRTQPMNNRGFNLFNLFGYVRKGDGGPLHLIYTRILQFAAEYSGASDEALIKEMSRFEYPRDDTERCLEHLVWAGMIESKYSPQASTRVELNIKPKGEYAKSVFYSDLHFLYHSCLDTLQVADDVRTMQVATNNNRLRKGQPRAYSAYSVINGLRFLQFLVSMSNHELRADEFGKSDREFYRLPIDWGSLRNSVSEMVGIAARRTEHWEILEEAYPEKEVQRC